MKMKVVLVLGSISIFFSACTPVGFDSFIEIQNQEEQYAAMEQELKDLKTIQVNCLAPERYVEMKDKIYENYFRNKDDKEHQQEETIDGNYGDVHSLNYKTEDDEIIMEWVDWGDFFVSYGGHPFGIDYIYETTEEQVIQEETEKLFGLFGLELGDRGNGYVIDEIQVCENNSVEVNARRYLGGKKVSRADVPYLENISERLQVVEEITIEFGNNQIIGFDFRWLTENPQIEDYEEEILVNSPEKAYKLLVNYIGSNVGTEKLGIDAAGIAYQPVRKKDNVYTLYPQAEFRRSDSIWHIYQINLTTKEVR